MRSSKDGNVPPPLWASKMPEKQIGDEGFFSIVGMGGSSLSSARGGHQLPISKSMGSMKQRPQSAIVTRRTSSTSR